MFELKIKDYEKVEEIPIKYYDDEMTCIKLDDESYLDVETIPCVEFGENKVYYLNKNNIDYITIKQNDILK